jgi:hypothetical protein
MYTPTEAERVQKEEGFEAGKWWQAIDADGKLLAETSSRSDFKHLGLDKLEGVTYRRLYERTERKWVEDNPFTTNTNSED